MTQNGEKGIWLGTTAAAATGGNDSVQKVKTKKNKMQSYWEIIKLEARKKAQSELQSAR